MIVNLGDKIAQREAQKEEAEYLREMSEPCPRSLLKDIATMRKDLPNSDWEKLDNMATMRKLMKIRKFRDRFDD